MNNLKITWKGIRNLIIWKQSNHQISIFCHKTMEQSQSLRKFLTFSLITLVRQQKNAKPKIIFLTKLFDEYLQDANKNSFFLKPTSSDENIKFENN